MFVHRGYVRTIQIIGVPGVDTVPMPYGPFNHRQARFSRYVVARSMRSKQTAASNHGNLYIKGRCRMISVGITVMVSVKNCILSRKALRVTL
jgi:hypothetical protein